MSVLYTQSFMQATSTAALADLGMVSGYNNTGRLAGRRTGAYSWSLGNTTTGGTSPRILYYWLDAVLQGSGVGRQGKFTLGFAVGLDRSKDLGDIAFFRTTSDNATDDPGSTAPMLGYHNTGVFYANGGGTVKTTPTTGFAWYYVEMQYTSSSGLFVIRIDGTQVFSGTVTAGAAVKGFSFLSSNDSSGYSWQVADLYLLDGTGPLNNDFLGDTRVETLTVSSGGSIAVQASGSAPDVQTPDDDTTKLVLNRTGQRATFNMTAPANTTGTIASVVVKASAKKTSGTPIGIKGLVKVSSLVYETGRVSDPGLTTGYTEADVAFGLNPNTGAAWTTAQVSALEAGIKLTPAQTITYVGATVHSADHTEGATSTIAVPAGLVAGDLMMLFVWQGSGGTFQTPTGWTFIDAGAMGALYTKPAGSSESALAYTFATAPGDRSMVMRAYRGSASTPAVQSEAHVESTNVNNVTAPTVTYVIDGMIVYGWGGFEGFSATPITPTNTLSHIVGTGEVVTSCSTADEAVTGAGNSTPRNATGLGGSDNWTTFTVLLA